MYFNQKGSLIESRSQRHVISDIFTSPFGFGNPQMDGTYIVQLRFKTKFHASFTCSHSLSHSLSHTDTQHIHREGYFISAPHIHFISIYYFFRPCCSDPQSYYGSSLFLDIPACNLSFVKGVFITDSCSFQTDAVSVISICCHTLLCPSHPVIFCAGLWTSWIYFCFADINEKPPPAQTTE